MQNPLYQSRKAGLWIIFFVYIVATGVGIATFKFVNPEWHILTKLFCADFTATVFVWMGSAVFRNSSVYDPYWSVAPVVLLTALAFYRNVFTTPVLLMLIAVWVWGTRLTFNWAITFRNLSIQDWRYDKYKNEFPVIWQLVNFTGIHLMPTIIVFLAMIPAIYLFQVSGPANFYTFLAFLLCLFAALLQLVSDNQMHRFRREQPGNVCNTGLWQLSRHPNYLGEILMWWGIYFILISTGGKEFLWTGIGALANTLLFVFISIPLMEKRQLKNKPEYAVYRTRTGMLLPKFKKSLPCVVIGILLTGAVETTEAQERIIIDRSPQIHIETDRDFIRRYEGEIEAFREKDKSVTDFSCDVLFFGSSSIRLWKTLEEDMSPLKVVNRGYGGATIRDILYNYSTVFSAYSPKKIVVYCDNDISGGSHDITVGDVYDLYRILFDQIRRDYPGVPVYYLSGKYSRSRASLREKQALINELIREYAESSDQVTYVDVNAALLKPDGNIEDSLFMEDRLHITREGYIRWTAVLKPYLLAE